MNSSKRSRISGEDSRRFRSHTRARILVAWLLARRRSQRGLPSSSLPSSPRASRARLDLDGPWRVDRQTLDDDWSLADRASSRADIEREAAGRQAPGFDDAA